MLESRRLLCPYCSAVIELVLDASVEYQQYVEDCQVCCRPMQIQVTVEFDHLGERLDLHLQVLAENDY